MIFKLKNQNQILDKNRYTLVLIYSKNREFLVAHVEFIWDINFDGFSGELDGKLWIVCKFIEKMWIICGFISGYARLVIFSGYAASV